MPIRWVWRPAPREVRPHEHHVDRRSAGRAVAVGAGRPILRAPGPGTGSSGQSGHRPGAPAAAQPADVDRERQRPSGRVRARHQPVGQHRPPAVRAEGVDQGVAHALGPTSPRRGHDAVRAGTGRRGAARSGGASPPSHARGPLGVADPVVPAAVVEEPALADRHGGRGCSCRRSRRPRAARGKAPAVQMLAMAPTAVGGVPARVGLEDAVGLVGVHEHGADHRSGVRPRGRDKTLQAVGLDEGVVVADQDEVRIVGPWLARSARLVPRGVVLLPSAVMISADGHRSRTASAVPSVDPSSTSTRCRSSPSRSAASTDCSHPRVTSRRWCTLAAITMRVSRRRVDRCQRAVTSPAAGSGPRCRRRAAARSAWPRR